MSAVTVLFPHKSCNQHCRFPGPLFQAPGFLLLVPFLIAFSLTTYAWNYGAFHEIYFTGSNGVSLYFYLFIPNEMDPDSQYPIVVWLHGMYKSVGGPIENPVINMDAFYNDDTQSKYKSYVLMPICAKDQNWVSETGSGVPVIYSMPDEPTRTMAVALEIIDSVIRGQGNIDTSRIYVVGGSMGGYATWDIIVRRPDFFAAAVPLCGGADTSKAPLVAHMNIWTYHGDQDDIIDITGTREMFKALIRARGVETVTVEDDRRTLFMSPDSTLRYSEHKGTGHAIYDMVLKDDDLLAWIFSKRLAEHGPDQDSTEVAAKKTLNAPAPDVSNRQSSGTARLSLQGRSLPRTFSAGVFFHNGKMHVSDGCAAHAKTSEKNFQ
jgi:poly(3-hydroxybutyrate) depolymerase